MRRLHLTGLVVVLGLALAAPAHSQTRGATIRSLGFCLDVYGASATSGANVQIWTCHGNPNQRWIFEDGLIRSAMSPTLCLDVYGESPTPGTNVQIWTCHGHANQRWTVDGGTIRSALAPNLCLDVYANTAASGTNVQIWTCNGGANQDWTIE